MNILIITGCNLQFNFSAGLSHNAYIQGLCKLGNVVDVLCYSEKDIDVDGSIQLPPIRHFYKYDGLSFYEKVSQKKQRYSGDLLSKAFPTDLKVSFKRRMVEFAKSKIRSCYGVYRMDIVWFWRAKRFYSNNEYDIIVSMSDPPISHKLAAYLIEKKRVKTNKWIQLWEDPWCDSFYGETTINTRCMKEEKKLLALAKDIVYVTPLTLRRQQSIFPKEASKMRWCPLATYYSSNSIDFSNLSGNYYGYFGDYPVHIRNLQPFYQVAVEKNLNVDICGSPSTLFPSKGNVHVYPRLTLHELKVHEDKVNVGICLFNHYGGQIPGKIYQLAATNKIILCILDGPEENQKIIRDYFGKYNRFIFCHNDENSISNAIECIEKKQLQNVSNDPIDDFEVEKIAKILLGGCCEN